MVENQDDYAENFNVSVCYTRMYDPLIGTQNITLAAGANTMLTFEWISNIARGYEIRAEASVVLGEFDTSNNIRVNYVPIYQPRDLGAVRGSPDLGNLLMQYRFRYLL